MATKPKNQDNQVETVEPYKPMAVPPVTDRDRIEALEARVAALEAQVRRHIEYHFGRNSSP